MTNDIKLPQTYMVSVRPHLKDKGDTPAERINWLHFKAMITWPTAQAWHAGTPSRVDLDVLGRITEALEVTVDQVLIPTTN